MKSTVIELMSGTAGVGVGIVAGDAVDVVVDVVVGTTGGSAR
jgi:hypothetical protein